MSLQILHNFPKIIILSSSPFFHTMAKSLYSALSTLNFNVEFDPGLTSFDNTSLYILFGAHLWGKIDLAKYYILYQTEQYTGNGFKLITNSSVEKCVQLWDYSIDNISNYSSELWKNKAVHIPFYYDKVMEGSYSNKYIDVFFVGSPSPHRMEIVSKLKENGIHVVIPHTRFGDNLLELLQRCKIGLNLHYFDDKPTILETSRVGPMLANKVCVVSENCHWKNDLKPFEPAIIVTDDIVNTVKSLLAKEDELQRHANIGYEEFCKLSLVNWLKNLT